jgi:hypothetical protein
MSPILARYVPIDWAAVLGVAAALLALALGAFLWFALRNRGK